jgi:isoamylase
VSYEQKHNEANGEDNKDGHNDNLSWNCGAEGHTDDEMVKILRERQKRNFLTTLFVSQGVPMIVSGDELGRTQNGNNNAYCQDNEISWVNWEKADQKLLDFTRKLIHFRREHPTFCRKNWFKGKPIKGLGVEDIAWFQPNGDEVTEEQWSEYSAKTLAIYMNGRGLKLIGAKGEKIVDGTFYLMFNAHSEALDFKLPPSKYATDWTKVLDTNIDLVNEESDKYAPEQMLSVQAHSIVILKDVNLSPEGKNKAQPTVKLEY